MRAGPARVRADPAVPRAGVTASAGLGRLGGLAAALRRHWLMAILLAAGLALRVVTQLAYRPALLYIDSIKYLFGAYPGNDPPGYQLVLQAFLKVGTLGLVAVLQHAAGLAMAVVLYLVLRRRGVPSWLAALATAPVLLDGYQLQIEQSIMPDTAFEVLIVAGLAALLWERRPPAALVLVAGLALGASATVRQVGEIFILPALVYLLAVTPGWRQKLVQAAALVVAFALPVLFISYRNYVTIRHFGLAPYAAGTIYGRAAAAADCATLSLPAYERPLCPPHRMQVLGPDWLDHGAGSPIKRAVPPTGLPHVTFADDFSRQVLLQQPLRVAAAWARDSVKLFAVTRDTDRGDVSVTRWQFQRTYPVYPPYIRLRNGRLLFVHLTPAGQPRVIRAGHRYADRPAVAAGLASFLRGYQLHGGYTPGLLFLCCVLAGLAGCAGLLRRRVSAGQRATAQACLLTTASAVAVLLASDFFEFSWRYQLPALVTLPPAGALGIMVVTGWAAGRRRPPAGAS
ncbi:MAG TPA: phospholipid carrier-dependent glycosyltransferase [Streptosporangiaceae bacterium]|nr:phospholipid carrier-dependent glycosyltransferase [Streptosporangiaceae bacterium]